MFKATGHAFRSTYGNLAGMDGGLGQERYLAGKVNSWPVPHISTNMCPDYEMVLPPQVAVTL